MLVFQVTSLVADQTFQMKVEDVYRAANLRLGSTYSWLVADNGVTTKEVSDKLGLVPGSTANAIVVRVDSYFGLTQKDVWEWLRVKTQGV